VVSGATLTTRAAVALVRDVWGRPERAWWLPPAAARAGGAAAEWLGRVLRRDVPVCRETVRTLLHGHRYDGSRAERELGLQYTPIEDTLRRTLGWYAERGLVPPAAKRRPEPGP
jgi:dihydroflavonol-4-reductase